MRNSARLLPALLLVLTACQAVTIPTVEPTVEPTIDTRPPPEVTVNGAPGQPLAWTNWTGIFDGIYDPTVTGTVTAPVTAPFMIETAKPATDITAEVFTDEAQASVSVTDHQIGPIPEGNWDRLFLYVNFDDGTNATYGWALELFVPLDG